MDEATRLEAPMTLVNIPTPPDRPRSTRAALRRGLAALLLVGVAGGAMAQYKIVGPDGHVTYTDKPPTATDMRAAANGSANGGAAAGAEAGGGLPYDVRQASSRYPVTLYAARGCVPCDQSRQWLRGHGIPFNEFSIDTNADIQLLQARFSDGTLPIVTIGSQTLKGFSSTDMQSYADAAGYPKQSRLGNYAWPAAVPLAPPARAATPGASSPTAPSNPSSPQITLPAPSSNGIQF